MPSLNRLSGLVFAVAMLCAPMVAHAQQGAFDTQFAKLIDAAKQEGELTWYNTSSEAAGREFAAHFEKRFGVKVNSAFAVAGPTFERFRSESQSGNHIADVFNADGTLLLQAISEGLIANYKTASISAYPANWVLQTDKGVAYPTNRVQMVMAYNTQMVKPEEVAKLSDWHAMVDPAFKDRISLADPTRSGSLYPTYFYFLRKAKDEYGKPFLEQIAEQNPIVYGSMTEQVGRIAASEVDMGMLVDVSAIQQYTRGAPIAFTFPKPTPVSLQYMGVSSNAPHPNAARLFIEYITSEEGMAEWGKVWGASTGRPDVDAKLERKFKSEPWYKDPEEFFLISDQAEAERERTGVINEWLQIIRKQ